MAGAELQGALVNLLAMRHFPPKPPRPKLGMKKITEALRRLGTETNPEDAFDALCILKGRGLAQTEPRIIEKGEIGSAEFEVWLTPMGRTEAEKAQ